MENIRRRIEITVSSLLVLGAAILALFYPVLSHGQIPPYNGAKIENLKPAHYDQAKKTVLIVADGKSTQMFDMLAPFYVFNATGQLNVFIVAKDQTPIPLKKDLYALPQLTFSQVDSMNIAADVIVIPALAARDDNQDAEIVKFIKTHTLENTKLISICDGASTAAATGLYDGKPITAHATDYQCVKKYWEKPKWMQNVTVTKSGNLYSTAGVSNAVDGSLQVIEDLLGKQARIKAAAAVNYKHEEIPTKHESKVMTFGNKLSMLNKITFNRKRVGVLLHNGLDEWKFASLVETYSRTYPKELKAFSLQDKVFQTKYGLTFINTNDNRVCPNMDEVYVVMPNLLTPLEESYFDGHELVKQNDTDYAIDQSLKRIAQQYGEHYAEVVKISLDYN